MRDYDAGIYKVIFSRSCDFVPSLAIVDNAPVIFVVQEYSLPTYNAYSTYYVTDTSSSILLSIQTNSSTLSPSSRWYRNGIMITESSMDNITVANQDGYATNTLHTVYNDTRDVTGTYVGITGLTLHLHNNVFAHGTVTN